MIFILLGKSCSGKTTVLNHLEKFHNQEKVTAITTRPIRKGEVNGVDYHFIRDEEFIALENLNKLICVRNYTVSNGDVWRYGFIKEEILNIRHLKFLVVDLDGFKELKQHPNLSCKGVYIDVHQDELKDRGLKRGDSLIELERRLESDSKDFEGIEKEVGYIVSVTKGDNPVMLAESIMKIVKAHEK